MKNLMFFIVFVLIPVISLAQKKVVYHKMKYKIESGLHKSESNNDKVAKPLEITVFTSLVEVPNAVSIRLVFEDYELGKSSKLKIVSLSDESYCQIFNMSSLNNWRGKSAIFKGNKLEISLIKSNLDEYVYFSLSDILVGTISQSTDDVESICDTDDRIRFEDGRVARMPLSEIDGLSCTAWLANNGAILTAGHCIDDGSGGISPFVDIIEFNVPDSDPDGSQNPALPQDQYPIDLTSLIWNDGGEGRDWGVMRCLPNANGQLPHQSQGVFFRMTREKPAVGNDIRITGYGADDGVNNDTEQTDVGPYVGEHTNGTSISQRYTVDTRGHNSGSPIIWEANNFTIGIHTFGGCHFTDYNGGTSFEHDPLENALQNFHGANTRYVDILSQSPIEDGTIFSPFNTVQEGVNSTPAGGGCISPQGHITIIRIYPLLKQLQ